MQIDLSRKEIELLDDALRVWEAEPHQSSLTAGMLATMICGREHRKEVVRESMEQLKDGENKCKERRVIAIMMRAKLFQVIARESEHAV